MIKTTAAENKKIRGELLIMREKWAKRKNEEMTLRELYDEYMAEYAPNCLKPSTITIYQTNLRNHILGVFGDMRVQEIDNHILSAYFCEFMSDRASIAHNVLHALSSLMNYAVRMHYIIQNPCPEVMLPKVRNKKHKRSLHFDELPAFFRLFDRGRTIDKIARLLLLSGMRVGEVCALQWDDIDFDSNTIHINKTVSKSAEGVYIGEPKTKNSNRTIYMGRCIRALLLDHRKMQQHLRRCKIHPEMVFVRDNGDYLTEFLVWYEFKRRVNNTHFSFLTPHVLRRSNASLLLNSGIDLKMVSSHLGHASIGVTANIYAEVLEPAQKKIARVTDEIFDGNPEEEVVDL